MSLSAPVTLLGTPFLRPTPALGGFRLAAVFITFVGGVVRAAERKRPRSLRYNGAKQPKEMETRADWTVIQPVRKYSFSTDRRALQAPYRAISRAKMTCAACMWSRTVCTGRSRWPAIVRYCWPRT